MTQGQTVQKPPEVVTIIYFHIMGRLSCFRCLVGMNFKQGISREQISMTSLDCYIAIDSPVRVIDLFVEQLDLGKLGFTKTALSKEGRPPFEAKYLLKLYYYGYLNKIRSSRKLEAECCRNVELWWLLYQLTPGYHTIADFRKDNSGAFKQAFKMFVGFLKGEGLVEGKTIVVDGTKIRAQNNKQNNFNEAKFAKSLAYIDARIEEYISELDASDANEDKQSVELKKNDVTKKLAELKERKTYYKALENTMIKSGQKQISMSDPDSRSLPIKDGVTDICYNIQSVADSKHSLIVAFDTINTIDQGQLCPMASEAMAVLEVKEIQVLADKGYHTGKDLEDCKEAKINTIVAYPQKSNNAIESNYQTSAFEYNKQQDTYTCPQGAVLTSNGKQYMKQKEGRSGYLAKKYTTDQCLTCVVKHLCTGARRREIERTQYQDVVDENRARVENNKALYRERKKIIEHPFGTIKRNWGYNYTLLKTKQKVNGEMAMIFTVYNLRRAMSILGVNELISKLKARKTHKCDPKKDNISYFNLYRTTRLHIAA